ncbi:hypothetical protein F4806DRAFT_75447 [Annulohypoxylon nitens]|nr:hypothetical protein F4806DRAFT_75447 [Annulohypoxylon nitens]
MRECSLHERCAVGYRMQDTRRETQTRTSRGRRTTIEYERKVPACQLYVNCMSTVCQLYVNCMSTVCQLYVNCIQYCRKLCYLCYPSGIFFSLSLKSPGLSAIYLLCVTRHGILIVCIIYCDAYLGTLASCMVCI